MGYRETAVSSILNNPSPYILLSEEDGSIYIESACKWVKLDLMVKFFANLRNITKVKEVEVETEQIENIELLLNKLVEMYGDQFRDTLFDDGKIRKFFKILRNGRDIDFEQGLETKLGKDDVVAIFPPAGGG